MSLIGTEIGELRKMQADLIAGKMDSKTANLRLKVYRETSSRAKMILDIYKLGTLKGLSFSKIASSGLISDGEIIPVNSANFDTELVQCPDQQGKNITREECLDYSGDSKNVNNCSSCKNFKQTRKKLM